MSGMGKLSREQMEAWLALEGWHPWQATYRSGKWGIRKGDYFLYNGCGYRVRDGSQACLSTEATCAWADLPRHHIDAYYRSLAK